MSNKNLSTLYTYKLMILKKQSKSDTHNSGLDIVCNQLKRQLLTGRLGKNREVQAQGAESFTE